MLTATGVTIRFGKRTLFEDVNIKFGKQRMLLRNYWCKWCW